VLAFIESFHQREAWPPTVREIAEGTGISSTGVVWDALNSLVERGYLARVTNRSRAIKVLRGLEAFDLDGEIDTLELRCPACQSGAVTVHPSRLGGTVLVCSTCGRNSDKVKPAPRRRVRRRLHSGPRRP
jgi:SOS-response transcriptional repressor LexA